MKNETTLTIENAKTASTIICKNHPEWGTKAFIYVEGNNSYFGRGSDSAMLFEKEFKFWNVVTTK